MVYSDDAPRQFTPRQTQMHDVSAMGLKCANTDCQKPITELPFIPSADRPVYCNEHKPQRRDFRRDRRW
jgi:CxxC-x17-CxxC domain-containing protein